MSVPHPVIPTGFRHRVAEHAASGALRDLLEHHGLSYVPEPMSEGAAFGFSGGRCASAMLADTGRSATPHASARALGVTRVRRSRWVMGSDYQTMV